MKALYLAVFLTLSLSHQSFAQHRQYSENNSSFRISIDGGYSYRLAKVSNDVPADFRNYVKGLKSGYNYGGSAAYFLPNNIGFGAEYHSFHTKNQMSVSAIDTTTGAIINGHMSDNLSVQYIGPAVYTRYIFGANDNLHFLIMLSLGYMHYKNDGYLLGNSYTITGSTMGMSTGIAFDAAISKNVFLGAKVNIAGGKITAFDVSSGSKVEHIKLADDKAEGLGRIDISAGLRFNF